MKNVDILQEVFMWLLLAPPFLWFCRLILGHIRGNREGSVGYGGNQDINAFHSDWDHHGGADCGHFGGGDFGHH